MQKFNGVALRQFDSVGTGNIEPSTQITVRNKSDNSLATIFSDNGVTPKENPTKTDARGRYSFYAANGTYVIEVGNPILIVEDEVRLFDPDDETFGIAEAPQDGSAYARIDGMWQRVASGAGGGYPAKVGDVYISASGPIDADRDLELDGSLVDASLYPDLGGLSGYPVLSDPTDFDEFSQQNLTAPASLRNLSILPNSNKIIGSVVTNGSSNGVYFSDDLFATSTQIWTTVPAPRGFKSLPSETGSKFVGYIGDSNTSVKTFVRIYDESNNTTTNWDRPVQDANAINYVDSPIFDDGIICVASKATESTSHDIYYNSSVSQELFSLATFSSSNSTIISSILRIDDYFYFFLSAAFSTAGVTEIIRTNDFASFEDYPLPPSTLVITSLTCTKSKIYGMPSSGNNIYTTNGDGSWTAVSPNVTLSTASPRVLQHIDGTENGLLFTSASGIASERVPYVSFDSGETFKQLPSGSNSTTAENYIGHICVFDAPSSKLVYSATGDLKTVDAIVGMGSIQLPSTTPPISEHKYYVRAK